MSVVSWPAVVAAADTVIVNVADHTIRVLQQQAYVRTVVLSLRPVSTWLYACGYHVTDHQLTRAIYTCCKSTND